MGNGFLLALRNVAALRVVALAFSLLFIASCIPSENTKILKGNVAGQTFFIPEVYFVLNSSGRAVGQTIYVHAMYPDFAPQTDSTQMLKQKDEWYKHIRMLAFYTQTPNLKGNLSNYLSRAPHKEGIMHGLSYYTSPPEEPNDNDEVFVETENGKPFSYIACGKKLSPYTIPHCKHHIVYDDHFWLTLTYDKRLLPYWLEIKNKAIQLFDSFNSLESARAFLSQFLRSKTEHHGFSRG